MKRNRVLFREGLHKRLKDPEFRKAYAEADSEVRLSVALADAREKAGLTQAQLAHILGTRQSNISRIEKGAQNVTLRTLERMAEALHRRIEIRLRPA